MRTALIGTLAIALSLAGCIDGLQEQLGQANTEDVTLAADLSGLEGQWQDLTATATTSARIDGTWVLVQDTTDHVLVADGEVQQLTLGPFPEGTTRAALTISALTGTDTNGTEVDRTFDPELRWLLPFDAAGQTLTISVEDWDALADGGTPTFTGAELRGADGVLGSTQGQGGGDADDEPAAKPPVARMTVFAANGVQLYKADFLAADGEVLGTRNGPVRQGEAITLQSVDSEALEPGAEITSYSWDVEGTSYEGKTVDATLDQAGAYHVTLTVEDSLGSTDTQSVIVIAVPTAMPDEVLVADWEDGAGDWTTTDDSAVAGSGWSHGEVSTGNMGWKVGTPPPLSDVQGYTANADASLISPAFDMPDWPLLGIQAEVNGASEACCDDLELQATTDAGETWTTLTTFQNTEDWTTVQLKGLGGIAGTADVQLRFRFSSDAAVEEGQGWEVDTLRVVGLQPDKVLNLELFQEAPAE